MWRGYRTFGGLTLFVAYQLAAPSWRNGKFAAGRTGFAGPYRLNSVGTGKPRPQEMQLSTLLSAPLACCRWELENRRMVPPSNEALRLIIETDPDLVADLNRFYGDATPDGGLDKAERETAARPARPAFHRPIVAAHRRDGGDTPVHGRITARHGGGRLETGRVRRSRLTRLAASRGGKSPPPGTPLP